MDKLQQYISRATRGLYGTKKLEIQAELRGSLEARIWQLERQGNTNALEMALNEMGAAKTINSGLLKEHLMPNISKVAFVVIAATALTIAGISSSQAQVGWATVQDDNLKNCFCTDIYININDLKASLEKAGATITESMSEPKKYSNRGIFFFMHQTHNNWDEKALVRTFDIQLPNTKQNQKLQLQALENFSLNAEEKIAIAPEEAAFISYNYIIDQFKTTKLPIQFTGWQTPKIQVGDFSFTLEKPGDTPKPIMVYNNTFINWWMYSGSRPGARNMLTFSLSMRLNASTDPYRHAIRTNDPANTIYAIVSSAGGFRSPVGEGKPPTTVTYARTNSQGILEFTTPFRILQFGKNSLLEKRTTVAGTEKNPAQALLLKFTGRIDDMAAPIEIVLPSKTKIAAIK
jgi:hypothetical protein